MTAGYPDADAAAGEEPAAGEHLPACPVLTDPRAADLDCRCWPWLDAQLAQLDTYDPAPTSEAAR